MSTENNGSSCYKQEHQVSKSEDSESDQIYLDYNATTPLATEVLEVIVHSLKNDWANPSSSYKIGEQAKRKIAAARDQVAEMLGAYANDIVFLSGGTEANNLVIHSAIEHFNKTRISNSVNKAVLPHIVTSNVEHDAIKLPLHHLKSQGLIDLTELPVSKLTGIISVSDVISALRLNTCLVTLMLANNETGVIFPIGDISKAVKSWKNENKKQMSGELFLHTDAAQAIGKIPVNVTNLGVDYLTIVGHKFYGPRIGALYVRGLGKDCPLIPQMLGGGQERGYRAGTENTPMIIGLGKAAELVTKNLEEYTDHMIKIKNNFVNGLRKAFPDLHFNNYFDGTEMLPNTVNVSFHGEQSKGHVVLSKCKSILASVGAACHSQNKPSAILLASGISEELASNAIRFSVGRETTENEIELAITELSVAHLALRLNQ